MQVRSLFIQLSLTLLIGLALAAPSASARTFESVIRSEQAIDKVGPDQRSRDAGSAAAEALLQLSFTTAGSALWQGTTTVTGDNNYAYAHKYFGLEVIDLSNPATPTKVAEYFFPAQVEQMVLRDGFLYCAAGEEGLVVYDVTNPLQPQIASKATVEELPFYGWVNAKGIELAGNYVYVSARHSLLIVDVSDPYAATVVTEVDVEGLAQHSTTLNGLTYVASDFFMETWDFSDPLNPMSKARKDVGFEVWDIDSDGSDLFISSRFEGLVSIGIMGYSYPTIAGTYIDSSGLWYEVDIVDQYAYLTGTNGVAIVDVNDPAAFTKINELPDNGRPTSLSVVNDQAYLADWEEGVFYYDLTDPSAPVLESHYPSPGLGGETFVEAGIGYHANRDRGLRILDLSDPEAPNVIGLLALSGEAWTVGKAGDYLLVGGDQPELNIVDVSAPSSPSLLTTIPLPSRASRIVIEGDLALLSTLSGLSFYDVTDPTVPALLGAVDVGSEAWDVRLDGNYCYMGSGSGFIYVIDISNPSAPTVLATSEYLDRIASMELVGKNLYVSAGYNGELYVYDMTVPTSPTMVWSDLSINGRQGYNMTAVGDYLYVASYTVGLNVYDISNPTVPQLAGHYETSPGWAWDVDVDGGMVYVSCDNGFLSLYQDGCGGPDGEGGIDPVDLSFLVDFFFLGGSAPPNDRTADVDCSGAVDPLDLALLVDFLFAGGAAPCGGCFD